LNKLDRHHLFSKTRWALKKYGKKLIDDKRNILIIPNGKHLNGVIPNYNEREYCKALELDKCEYCKWHIAPVVDQELEIPCFKYEGYGAEFCREFDFDLKKYRGG